jgi:hypothetical protein
MTTDPRDQLWECFVTELLLARSIGLAPRNATHPPIGYGNDKQLNTCLWFEGVVPWQVTVAMAAGLAPAPYWYAESAFFTNAYKRALVRLERRLKSINRHPTQKHI